MKIRAKLTTFFSIICIGCMLVAIMCIVSVVKTRVASMNDEKYQAEARYYATKVSEWLEGNSAVLDTIDVYMERQEQIDKDRLWDFLQALTKENENTTDIYVKI